MKIISMFFYPLSLFVPHFYPLSLFLSHSLTFLPSHSLFSLPPSLLSPLTLFLSPLSRVCPWYPEL